MGDAEQHMQVRVSRVALFNKGNCAELRSECYKNLTKTVARALDQYARSRGSNLAEVEQLSTSELDSYLTHFYSQLRRNNGSEYSRKGFISLIYALRHHFRASNGIDILSGNDYTSANQMFSAKLVRIEEHDSEEDFKKLYSSDVLSTSTPTGLQNKVFVDLMIHNCSQGRSNMKSFSRTDFKVLSDVDGTKYICLHEDRRASNNHWKTRFRINEQSGHPGCPVSSFEKYMSKLNSKCEAFWQVPIKESTSARASWYESAPVDEKTLCEKMKTLSVAAGLSTIYTNYRLRGAFDRNGFEARILGVIPKRSLSSSCIRSHKTRQNCITPASRLSVVGDRTGTRKKKRLTLKNATADTYQQSTPVHLCRENDEEANWEERSSTDLGKSNGENSQITAAAKSDHKRASISRPTSEILTKDLKDISFESRVISFRRQTNKRTSYAPQRKPYCKSISPSNPPRKSTRLLNKTLTPHGANAERISQSCVHRPISTLTRRKSCVVKEETVSCDISFQRPEYLYVCTHCCRIFEEKTELTEHIRMHIGGRPNECFICSEEFARKDELDDHSRLLHMGGNSFVCSLCNRIFDAKDQLDVHTKIHQKKRKGYDSCEVNANTISTELVAEDQFDIHTEEHQFEQSPSCDLCTETFSQEDRLVEHQELHEDENRTTFHNKFVEYVSSNV